MSQAHAPAPLQHRPTANIANPSESASSSNGLLAYQHQRVPSEMRTRNNAAAANGNGNGNGNGHARNPSGVAVAPFEMARSPPNSSTKNTKHVPCKFFRQGACQAGPACPFLHSTDATIESAPCKYFTKGNCKFGAKCALAHILPDGRRVNRPNFGGGGGNGGAGSGGAGGHLNLGGRVNPQAFHSQDSALTNSVLSQQRMNGQDSRFAYQYAGQDELAAAAHGHQQQQQQQPFEDGAGLISDSKYGSPETSPPPALTLRDVQLPASFDSQGISHMARYGPVAASVPSQFGLELASPPAQRAPSDALRNLRDTAFASDLRRPTSNFGSSPPAVMMDESSQSRFLHSQRIVPRSKVFSASVPRPSALDDWDDNFAMEEDYLPGSLHDDVLTPQEKMRRLSRTDHELSSSQRDPSGLGMAGTSATKVGSPLASSPSRFGALFARQRQRKEEEALGAPTSSSSLHHIGSPLRESSMHHLKSSPSLRPIGSRSVSGDVSPFVSSPGRQSSMSMISQQLNNMSLHPSSARQQQQQQQSALGSNFGLGLGSTRTASSPMTSSRIDEEQGDLVFSMEEEENNKRNSLAWNSSNKSTSSTTEETPLANTSPSHDLEYQS